MSECKARVLVFSQTFWRCLHDKCFTFVMHFLMIDLYHIISGRKIPCLRLKSRGGFSHKVTGKPELDGKGSKLFFGSVSLQIKVFRTFWNENLSLSHQFLPNYMRMSTLVTKQEREKWFSSGIFRSRSYTKFLRSGCCHWIDVGAIVRQLAWQVHWLATSCFLSSC